MRLLRSPIATVLAGLALGVWLAGRAWAAVMCSPDGDGVKDTAVFRIAVANPENLARWTFEITTADGKLLATFSGTAAPPPTLEWDGKDLTGRLVADGTYRYGLSVVTRAGVQVRAPLQEVMVDRVKPVVSLSVDPALFSPNGDGVKDEATFRLSATDANGIHSWLLEIKDKDGLVAKHFAGEGVPPAAVIWDGRGSFDTDVPDGTYAFQLTVQDPAGNSVTTSPQTVTINRQAIISTLEASPRIFSPNGDGVKDQVVIAIHSASPDTVDSWQIQILNRQGKPVAEFSGKGPAPVRLVWDGKQPKGGVYPDGPYQILLMETDRAGNRARTAPQVVELDNTPPAVELRMEPAGLSPNGDGVKDEAVILLKITDDHAIEYWAVEVLNDVGVAARRFQGTGLPTGRITWKADDDGGRVLADGTYTYLLTARDVAGNAAATPKQRLRVDKSPPAVSLAVSPELFSPNADGVLDTVTVDARVEDASPLEFWMVGIATAPGGRPVRTFKGLDPPTTPLVWDGKSDERAMLPDGTYLVSLRAKDTLGNESVTPPQKVVLGATKPQVAIAANWESFSPNADGIRDTVTFGLSVGGFNPLQEWSVRIQDLQGGLLRTFTGWGPPPKEVVWEGGRDDKRMLLDGEYRYSLEAVDKAGNRSATPARPIRIDTTRPDLSASISPDLFSPNGDKVRDEATFSLVYRDASPCRIWVLEIRDEAKRPVFRLEGTGMPPVASPYGGLGKDGRVLPDGPYTFVFSAEDEVGNRSATPDQIFRVDTAPPVLKLSADPLLFSPDGDGVRDNTTFYLEYRDASDLERWTLRIVGKDPSAARSISGLGRPGTSLAWDGRGDGTAILPDGAYTATLRARDVVGNEGESPKVSLTIDTARPLIQVTAEEQTLKTLATQAPVQETPQGLVISLAAEVLFESALAEIKPVAYDTLLKAANLLKKHPTRRIRIEGHTDAMPIRTLQFGNNEKLSEARARAVSRFFVERAGIPPERLLAVGYGETRPIASNTSEEGRQRNRRVEIILLKEGPGLKEPGARAGAATPSAGRPSSPPLSGK